VRFCCRAERPIPEHHHACDNVFYSGPPAIGKANRTASSVVMFAGALSDHHAAQWLRSVAPKAHVAARADSLAALLLAVKSGAGIAPMPIIVGQNEKDLVHILDLGPEMSTPFYLLMHQDMRRTPRVRAFFDFVIEHLAIIRPLLAPAQSATVRRTRRVR